MCSTDTPTFPDNNDLYNNIQNNLFLPGFSSSPGWLPVTRTRSAECRFRGYGRSRPRYLSPRYRICPQEWHCKDIHSHIHSHTPVHTPQKKKRAKHSTDQTWRLHLLVLFLSKSRGGRRPGSFAPAPHDFPTSEAFSPRTVLTENICRCVQQIFQHRPATIPFLTTSTITLPSFSSSPGWLLVTRTRGAWWCRNRGHWRSGARHLSPRSRVCAQEWHRKDIHSHSHSDPPMHTTKTQSKTLNSPNMTASFSWPLLSNVVVGDGQKAWQICVTTAPRRRPSRLEQYWQKTFVHVFNTYSNISRQQWPFQQPPQ